MRDSDLEVMLEVDMKASKSFLNWRTLQLESYEMTQHTHEQHAAVWNYNHLASCSFATTKASEGHGSLALPDIFFARGLRCCHSDHLKLEPFSWATSIVRAKAKFGDLTSMIFRYGSVVSGLHIPHCRCCFLIDYNYCIVHG